MISATHFQRSWFAFGAALFAGLAVTAVQAQDDAPPAATGGECLALRTLDNLRAVNDKTILFFMRGRDGEIFRNDVQGVCRGLERNRTFSYQTISTHNPRLCRGELITVRDTGVTCPLGDFRMISKEEAKNLTRARTDANAAPVPAVKVLP